MDDRRPLVLMLILANVAGVMISLIFKSYQDRMRSRVSSDSIKSLRILTRSREVETSPQGGTSSVSPLKKNFERSPAREESQHIKQRLAPTRGQDVRLSPIKSRNIRKPQYPEQKAQYSTNRKSPQNPLAIERQTPQKPRSPLIQKQRWPFYQKPKSPQETRVETQDREIKRKRIQTRNVPAVREESLMMTPTAFQRLPDENPRNEDEPQGFYSTAMDLLHHLEPLLMKPTCPPRRSVDPMDTSRKHFYDIKDDSESNIDDSANENLDGPNRGAKSQDSAFKKRPSSKSIPVIKTQDFIKPETSKRVSKYSKGTSPKRESIKSIPREQSEEIQLYKIIDSKKEEKRSPSKGKNRFSFLEPPQEKDEFFIKENISPVRIPSRSRLSVLDDTKKVSPKRSSTIKTFEQTSPIKNLESSPKNEKIRSPPVEHQHTLYKKIVSPPLKERKESSPDARKSTESYNVEGLGKKGESKHPSLLSSEASLHDREPSQRRSLEKLDDVNKKYFDQDNEYKFVSTTITRPPEFLEVDERDQPDSYGKRNANSPELRCCRGWAISKDKFFDFRRRPKAKEVKKNENLIKYDVIKPIPSLVQSNQVNNETHATMVKEKEEDRSVNFKQN